MNPKHMTLIMPARNAIRQQLESAAGVAYVLNAMRVIRMGHRNSKHS
jgi:hypothetical protein